MKLSIAAFICAILLSLIVGYFTLPILKKLHVGQTINSDGPDSHKSKQGTLTMGGIIFIAAGTVVSVLFSLRKSYDGHLFLFCLSCMLAFALVGFLDDWLKVVKHRSVGLTPKQKLAPQILFAILFAVLAYANPCIGSKLIIPFTGKELDISVFYIPFAAFVLVAVDNSANLLDGLDGLCSGNSLIAFAMYAIFCALLGEAYSNISMFALVMCASLCGFLRFNAYPARVFMGDAGSLALGGALGALALSTRSILILPLALITMLISSLTDIMQIIYMRRHRGRKLFRMAPYHHHLELIGNPETRIVTLYNLISLVGCALALLSVI